ncbi:MAG: putative Ig domain-containing protein, partial [Thermomicrobiales bacterium]
GSQAYTLSVTTPTITLSPATLPGGVRSVAYPATTLAAAGGTAPYTFTVTTGMLPTGLMLSPSGLLSGTPTAGGTFTFTVTATDANGFTGMQQYTITVSTTAPPTLKSIALTGPGGTPPPTTLKVGQSVAITATGTFSDGSTQNLSTQVQWSSSNATVAKVDTTGTVTGESPGTATISATLNGVSQSFTVTVGAPTPIGITVQPAPASRPSGMGIMPPGSPAPAAAPVGR